MAINAHVVPQKPVDTKTEQSKRPEAGYEPAKIDLNFYRQPYTGPYTVTPSGQAVTLATSGFVMGQNITVDPIPSNYGLITWDGTIITVS